jgi:NitT/TauT family transport system permease protein
MRISKRNLLSMICGSLTLGLLWAIWEYAGAREWPSFRLFPPPSRFLLALSDDQFKVGLGAQAATIPQSVFSTILRVTLGLGIAFIVAILFGFLVSSSIWIKRFTMPVIRLLAPIAPVAWIPLALVLFGIGNPTAIFIVFMGVFFTLTIATIQAIEDVPHHLLNAAVTLGAKPLQIWFYVIFPYILPRVFTILRLNFIAAWMAVLAAEMTGLSDGLGAIIMIGRNLFDNNLILLGMSLIGIVGFIGDFLLKTIQNKVFWWGNQ